jgi:GNAT superfamily N-acetyltransferase
MSGTPNRPWSPGLRPHLGWLERAAGHRPRGCTSRRGTAGRSQLPVTWVASEDSGALDAVGLGQFDIEERRDRSPCVLGMIIRRDCRGTGLGRPLLGNLERWARDQGHEQLWVATGRPAVNFYQRCGWQLQEIVHRDFEPATVLTKLLDPIFVDIQPASDSTNGADRASVGRSAIERPMATDDRLVPH